MSALFHDCRFRIDCFSSIIQAIVTSGCSPPSALGCELRLPCLKQITLGYANGKTIKHLLGYGAVQQDKMEEKERQAKGLVSLCQNPVESTRKP